MSNLMVLGTFLVNFVYYFLMPNILLLSIISFVSWENMFIFSNWGWITRLLLFLLNSSSLIIIINYFTAAQRGTIIVYRSKYGDIELIN
jgi:hypothetical protein